jgi:hypothetical protein
MTTQERDPSGSAAHPVSRLAQVIHELLVDELGVDPNHVSVAIAVAGDTVVIRKLADDRARVGDVG